MKQLALGGAPATKGNYAVISRCERYRYELGRVVDESNPRTLVWCMLNPSTADAAVDDPTIRKVRGFTQRFSFGRFVVVNAYAYRATDPRDLWAAQRDGVHVFGPDNGDTLRRLSREHDHCVVAWGAHLKDKTHEQTVLGALQYGPLTLWTLGRTKSGNPRHPLMLPYSTQREPWRPA